MLSIKQEMEEEKQSNNISRNRRNPNFFTNFNKSYGSEKKQLKALFLENEKNQIQNYIKDLEDTVRINKEIITELLKSNKTNNNDINEKLNSENVKLLKQLAETTKKQTEVQSQLLITDQIMKELKLKEEEVRLEFAETKQEFLSQLSKKEYILQFYEQKNQTLEGLLKKYAKKEPELSVAMKELNTEVNPRYIENVVIENNDLNKKLIESNIRIKELEAKINTITTENQKQAKLIEELNKTATKQPIKISSLDLSKISRYSSMKNNQASYIHRLEETIKEKNAEIALLYKKIEILQKNTKKLELNLRNLFSTNEKLSEALTEVKDKFGQKKGFNKTGTLKFSGLSIKKLDDECEKLQGGRAQNRSSSTKHGKAINFEKSNEERLKIANLLKRNEEETRDLCFDEPLQTEFNDISSISKPLPKELANIIN